MTHTGGRPGDEFDRLVPAPTDSLSVEDKVALTTGADYWSTHPAPRAGLRSVRLADGPHGLRVQDDENPDHLGLGRSLPATCFPPAVTLASSWDRDLIRSVGAALGREARASGVDVLLGPGLNIKRSPLCGRNFEYFSEDPLLSGVLAGAMVDGLQSEGVGACVKHFAANNQETDRQRVSAEVDERALREIYLRTFQIAIREASPWAIMSSYNRINGVYASENPWLLTEMLRGEWGYDGLVVSDWGAVHDPIQAVQAGLDLRMPGRPEDPRVREAAAVGSLDHAALDRTAQSLARLAERTAPTAPAPIVNHDEHHALVRRAAAESAVLLTNRDNFLPLTPTAGMRIAVIGELARTPRYQGAGSSAVNPTRVVSGLDAFTTRIADAGAELHFAPGYSLTEKHQPADAIEDALALASRSDVVICFVGLPGHYEAEGRDRTTIDLPTDQLALLDALKDVPATTVVALSNGSAVTTAAWRDGVDAIVEFWLTGQAHGDTVADVLLGDVNPSGKLAETVPVRLADTPSFLNFPGEHGKVIYGEGIYVGYRYYDARSIAVDYPFGHGMSYTTFEYADLRVTTHGVADQLALSIELSVTNTGTRAGAEVVQVYLTDRSATARTPPLELRAWEKVRLEPGTSTIAHLDITREDLEHWSGAARAWVYEGGPATVHVGSSSRDLRLTEDIDIPGDPVVIPLTIWSTFREWLTHPEVGPQVQRILDDRGGIKGRMADLLSDETGRDSVLEVPLQSLLEFPGVPLTLQDTMAFTGQRS